MLCLVFDFGGGTLDISVVEISPGRVNVKTSHGDYNCGGQDIDDILMRWIMNDIQQKHSLDLSNNDKAKAKVRVEAKKAKEALQADKVTETDIFVEAILDGDDYSFEGMQKAKFNQIC